MRVFLLAPFRNAYILRGLVVWGGLRFAFLVFEIVTLGALVKLGILAVVGTTVYLDARRRGEDMFLGNLGVAGVWIAAVSIPIPALLEFVIL